MTLYERMVKELGKDGARKYMQELGRKGGKKGGGKGGFHTMDKERLKEISAKGGRSGKRV